MSRSPTAPPSDYVELRCRSAFSFLDGASQSRGSRRARRRARPSARSRSPIAAGSTARRASTRPRSARASRAIVGATPSTSSAAAALLLLVESQRGYRNLCGCSRSRPRARREGRARGRRGTSVEAHAGGLVALCARRRVARRRRARSDRARRASGRAAVGRRVAPPRRRAEGETRWAVAARRSRAACRSSRPTTCATRARRAARCFDALTCLRHDDLARPRRAPARARTPSATCASPREMARRFADRPEWIARDARDRRALRVHASHDLGYRFPDFPLPPARAEASMLRRLTWARRARALRRPAPGACAPPARARARA